MQAQDIIKLKAFSLPRTALWDGKKSSEYEILISRFFGWYLSEGCTTKRAEKYRNGSVQVSISQKKEENRNRIESILKQLGLSYGVSKDAFTIQGEFAKWVYSICPQKAHEKRIPDFIKDLDSAAINAFLEEFCLGDGHRRTTDCFGYSSDEVCYYTSSAYLVSDLSELIIKSGKSVKIAIDAPKGTMCTFKNGTFYSNHDCFCIRESKSPSTRFASNNKSSIVNVDYDDYVYCLELEKNHVLLFERNGYMAWCGNCRCHLVCFPPNSPEEIPDTAPGLPTFGEPEEILSYKQQIFSKLQTFPVDRWTMLSPLIYMEVNQADAHIVDEGDVYQTTPYVKEQKLYKQKYKSSLFEEERLIYSASDWIDDIQPIKISKSYLFKSSMGPVRPIPNTYVGFQLSVTDTHAMVFLGDISRTILAPRDCIEAIDLHPVSLEEMDSNSFMRIDDVYGLVIRVLEDGKAQCYLPDFDEIVSVYPESAFKAS